MRLTQQGCAGDNRPDQAALMSGPEKICLKAGIREGRQDQQQAAKSAKVGWEDVCVGVMWVTIGVPKYYVNRKIEIFRKQMIVRMKKENRSR